MAGKIFINYRRDDSPGTTGRLHDRLAQTFGRKNLFMDVDHVPAGVDFVDYLHKQVTACDVFLAIIGPNWLDAKDDDGRRRFGNPDDFVTIEIAAALTRNIRVIPVLVDGARTPKADKLPDSIKPLVRRNAVEVRNTNFGRDAEALANKVREALKDAPTVPRLQPFMASAAAWLMVPGRWRKVAGSAMALLLVGWVGLYQTGVPVWVPWTPRAEHPDPPGADKSKPAADAEAQRKAEEAEQQRIAAAKAEEDRKAKAAAEAEAKRKAEEAEQQRLAAVKADEERKAKAAAEAEAKRKAAEVEQQRTAAAKADEERKAKAAAEAEAKQAEAQARARYSALVSQSRTALSNRDYDGAIATASEAIRLDPKNAIAFYNRGFAYWRKSDDDRAIADYNEAIRLDPNYADTFGNRGNVYLRKGDNDRAIADYNEVIRLNPTNATAFYNRGVAYARKGDDDRTIADYNEAIRLNPNYADAFGNRGNAYGRKGDHDRAMADYNEAIRLDPKNAWAFCNRGRAKVKNNEASGNADIAKAREMDASICR
jgi:tetratricopeptide (TPR) repeat protein